jgi:diguanylate cyclase (GGDEF)-like protein
VGSSLQEILSGGGEKKRPFLRIAVRTAPYLLLALLSSVFALGYETTYPYIFLLLFSLYIISSLITLFRGKRAPVLILLGVQFLGEFLMLKYQGLPVDAHMVHLSFYLICLSILDLRSALLYTVLQPLPHIHEVINGKYLEVALLLAAMFLTGGVVLFVIERLRRRLGSYQQSFSRLRKGADGLVEAGPELGRESMLSQYLSYIEERERDLLDILIIAERSLAADSVNLMLLEEGHLRASLSSGQEHLALEDEGLVHQVLSTKNSLFMIAERQNELRVGYNREGLLSFMGVPVMDGETILGVLVADSSRYRAFDQKDLDLLDMFSGEVAKVLRRQRMFARIEIEYRSLRILYRESARYGEILDIEEVSSRVVRSAEEISGARALLFLKQKRGYAVVPPSGKGRITRWKGSLLGRVIETGEAVYRSDLSRDSLPALPEGLNIEGEIISVIFIPMFHEDETVGVLTVLSSERDAFTSHLFELLKVLAAQASLSISNALLHEEIRMLALTDGLTGLYNHRHFQERLSEEFKKAERFSEPLSLILTDIDHFKKVNDTYGHPAGDMVLKGFSGIIRETVREIDIPARYGGEEFAIMALKADADEARKIAERIRKRVEAHRFEADGVSIGVTVSLGIASYPRDASSREELIERADQALYKAKESGRNRTVLYSRIKGV